MSDKALFGKMKKPKAVKAKVKAVKRHSATPPLKPSKATFGKAKPKKVQGY